MPATKTKDVTFRLKLLEWKQFAQGADAGGKAVKHLGTEAETAGKKAGASARGWGIYSRETQNARRKAEAAKFSFGKLGATLGGLGVGVAGIAGLKDTVETTKELGESAINLNKIQGVSLKMASQYALVAQAQGIGAKPFAQTLNILSRNIVTADKQWSKSSSSRVANTKATQAKLLAAQQAYDRKVAVLGNSAKDRVRGQLELTALQQKRTAILAAQKGPAGLGTAAEAFKKLGYSQSQVAAGGKDLGGFLVGLSERFNDLKGSSDKANVGLKLFGRGAQNVLPLFKEGDESLKTRLKWAKEFGAPTTKQGMKDFIVASDKSRIATLGLEASIGVKLMPAFAKVLQAWPRLITNIKQGNGAWGSVKTIVSGAAATLSAIVGVFQKSKVATQGLVWGLGLLGAAWGVQKIVLAYRAVKAWWVITKLAAAGSWALAAANRALAVSFASTAISPRARGASTAAGTFMGTWMGKAAGVALAAGVLYELPKLYQLVGGSFGQEAKRGYRDLIPGMEENAGPKNEYGAFLNKLYSNPASLAQKLKQGALGPKTQNDLRGVFAAHHRKPPPGLLRLPKSARVDTPRSAGTGGKDKYTHVTQVDVHLDKKVLAQAMAKEFVDLRARA